MRIAILSTSHVASKYAAALMERGHQVIVGDGPARDSSSLAPFLECDGCLLLGHDEALVIIAAEMEAAGKTVWHDLSQIPRQTRP